MKFNPHHLKKAELLVYLTGYCKHSHKYAMHKNCFANEILNNGKTLRIGVLDIETCGLSFNADGSIMISYYIKEYGKQKYHSSFIDLDDIRNGKMDKEIIKKLRDDMKKFNVIITYNGKYFDIPYIRTRCLIHNLKFLPYGSVKHIDLYPTIKNKFKFHRSSLKVACKNLSIDGKTELDFYTWIKAIAGSYKAICEILEHNKHDVDITEKLYDRVIEYERKIRTSI